MASLKGPKGHYQEDFVGERDICIIYSIYLLLMKQMDIFKHCSRLIYQGEVKNLLLHEHH